MANYYTSARTNYFTVTNEDAFRKWACQFPSAYVIHRKHEDVSQFGFLFDEDDGVPSHFFDQNDEEQEVDFMAELAAFLPDGVVAILISVGAEKLRYVNGYAMAINNKLESREIGLDRIYALAAELGQYTHAEY